MYSDKKMNGIGGDIAEESKFLAKIWDVLIGYQAFWSQDGTKTAALTFNCCFGICATY